MYTSTLVTGEVAQTPNHPAAKSDAKSLAVRWVSCRGAFVFTPVSKLPQSLRIELDPEKERGIWGKRCPSNVLVCGDANEDGIQGDQRLALAKAERRGCKEELQNAKIT